MVIMVDDESRENEGDFVAAAEVITPDKINFMATHGRGLICTPLTEKKCKKLNIGMVLAFVTEVRGRDTCPELNLLLDQLEKQLL